MMKTSLPRFSQDLQKDYLLAEEEDNGSSGPSNFNVDNL